MNANMTADPSEIQISPGLQKVVSRCLEKHREARYQSAADLAFHLENLSDISGPREKQGAVLEAARVALDRLTADPQSDLVSVGAALYEMLSGSRPAEEPANLAGSEA